MTTTLPPPTVSVIPAHGESSFIYFFPSVPAEGSCSCRRRKAHRPKKKKKSISAYLKLRDGAVGNPSPIKNGLGGREDGGVEESRGGGRECPCALGAGSGAEADRWTETEVSGLLPLFHAGGPGCGDCQRVVNYLNQERGDGNGCICHTSS